MNKGITVNKIFSYLIIFILLFDGSNMWQLTGSVELATMSARLLAIGICFVAILATLSFYKVKLSMHFLRNLLVVTILFAVLWLGTRYNLIYFLRVQYLMFLSFTVYMYILMKYRLIKDFIRAFVNIWTVLAIVTSVIWFFSSVVNVIQLKQMTYYWAEALRPTYTFYRIYFANPVQALTVAGGKFFRNTMIYAEAPGAGTYFLYAIGLELSFLKNDRNHFKRLMILVLTSFTTMSTKALIFVPILLALSYIFETSSKTQRGKINIFHLLIYIVVFIGASYFVYSQLSAKSDTGSYSIRADDVSAALKVFRQYPVFGVGLGNTLPIIRQFTVWRNNDGLSMGLTLMLAQGGIWLTTMYLAPFILTLIRFFKTPQYRRFILFGLGVLFNLIISNIVSAPSFLMIVGAGYAYFNLTEIEKNNLLVE